MNNLRTAVFCLWFSLVAFMVFGTFIMKNRVQDLEKELANINTSIKEDVRTIHILKAEWSHLNNPQRLRSLAQKHISLEPVKPEQIISYTSLPFDYELEAVEKKILARQNLSARANQNREVKQLAKMQ